MRRIYVELSDEEAKELEKLLNFIKLKIGIKKAFLQGIFYLIEKNTRNVKERKIIREIRKRIKV